MTFCLTGLGSDFDFDCVHSHCGFLLELESAIAISIEDETWSGESVIFEVIWNVVCRG
jgi:hypothetical protein